MKEKLSSRHSFSSGGIVFCINFFYFRLSHSCMNVFCFTVFVMKIDTEEGGGSITIGIIRCI